MKKTGIDISEHNGYIDWDSVKTNIDFCFIRAGYGNNNIDARAVINARKCDERKIPFGLYWFSYALTEYMAKQEAKFVCDFADDYNPTLPIAFDWEYDSDNYARKCGVEITNEKRIKFATVFMEEVKKRGYTPMLYTNLDYIKNYGFDIFLTVYPIWLAEWETNKPSVECQYWQKTPQGCVKGISTNVDIDEQMEEGKKEKDYSDIKEYATEKYIQIAKDIICGKYGVGEERKSMLKELGYDYEIAQMIVNRMLE